MSHDAGFKGDQGRFLIGQELFEFAPGDFFTLQ